MTLFKIVRRGQSDWWKYILQSPNKSLPPLQICLGTLVLRHDWDGMGWLLDRYLYTVDKWKTLLEYFVFCTKKKNLNSTPFLEYLYQQSTCLFCMCMFPSLWLDFIPPQVARNLTTWRAAVQVVRNLTTWWEIWPPGAVKKKSQNWNLGVLALLHNYFRLKGLGDNWPP